MCQPPCVACVHCPLTQSPTLPPSLPPSLPLSLPSLPTARRALPACPPPSYGIERSHKLLQRWCMPSLVQQCCFTRTPTREGGREGTEGGGEGLRERMVGRDGLSLSRRLSLCCPLPCGAGHEGTAGDQVMRKARPIRSCARRDLIGTSPYSKVRAHPPFLSLSLSLSLYLSIPPSLRPSLLAVLASRVIEV